MYRLGVYAHPGCASWKEITAAVRTANGLQTYFKCTLHPLTEPLSPRAKAVNVRTFEKHLKSAQPPVTGLIFCEERFLKSILIHEVLPERIYVSCRVPKGDTAPSFRLYLMYQIAAAALTLGAHLRPETNRGMIHRRRPAGCLWDWWTDSNQRATAMMMARICPSCWNTLKIHGDLRDEGIVAGRQILEYVRRTMLGDSPTVANRVFIAYGRSPDWRVLKAILEHWQLEVDYFRRTATTGKLIAERWREMLDESRFAFAVMTPDDRLADGRSQARQNVVHEIGLCHAHVGLRNTAILLATGTAKFSNVAGVDYIDFRKGHIVATAEGIHLLLKDRGILDPDHELTLPKGIRLK
jgi:Predicted nucleotide-binding protein containing TIR-like domain